MTTPQAETEAQAPYLPTYGDIEWPVLIAAVRDAVGARPTIDPKFYIGHQSPGINFNSLNRIVSGFVRAALTPKPLSVAPDDEALMTNYAHAYETVCEYIRDGEAVPQDAHNDLQEAREDLRRRIAGLLDKIDGLDSDCKASQAALAACRDKTIEADDATVLLVAKAIAPTYGDTPEIAWAHLTARGEEGLYLAQARDAIRALKDKGVEHG